MTFTRLISVNGRGSLDLAASYSVGPVTPVVPPTVGTLKVSSNLESATVASPISREDMWDFIGTQYGSYSNFTNTSVIATTGLSGATTKVLQQHFPATVSGSTSNYAMPPTGTGIALTSTPLAGGAVDEATIEFDFRAKSSGVPWGWGGKIPGLGGIKPGQGSVPTGGSPSPYGFSARLMFRRQGSDTANLQAKLVGYFYSPSLPSGAIGNDLATNKFLVANQWHHLKQYHKMNTVVTEGSTSPPADGIHRIWLDGVLCYESTTTVYRYYSDANITHLVWDNFYGGSDVADAPNTWGPTSDSDHQFDNLVITSGGSVAPSADTTAPSMPTNVVATNITSTGFTVSWSPSTDDVGVQRYSVQVDGTTYATPTATIVDVTGRTPSTNYLVRVQARDTSGNYSALTSAITVTTSAAVDNGFSATAPTGPTGTFVLNFSDDFLGSTLDTTRWTPHWFSEGGVHNTSGTYAANVAVHDSVVWLALPDATHGAEINSNPNGGATTGYQFGNGYYVEARVWFPGDGTNLYNWAAWWATGQNWPMTGENDIAEILSGKMTSNYHYGNPTDSPQGSGSYSGYYGDAWHTFGVHRKSGTSDFYIDGVQRWTVTTGDGGAPQFLVFNLQANSGASNVNYNTAVAQVRMDWVKAWVQSAPVAAFTGTPLSGTTPLSVQFTSTSTGTPTSYAWTFGDGSTSTVASPSHTYSTAGTYTVALTVTNAAGSNTQTRTGYVTASAPAPVISQVGTPSLYESASATSAVIPVPSGVVAGNLLLASVTHSAGFDLVAPTGWQLAAMPTNTVSGSLRTALFYRFATASEPANYTFATFTTAGRVTGVMVAYSGVDATTPLDTTPTTVESGVQTTPLVLPSLTTVTAKALLVSVYAVNAATAATGTPPATMTALSGAASTGTGRRALWATESTTTAGATGTRSWQINPTTTGLSQDAVLVALRPAT